MGAQETKNTLQVISATSGTAAVVAASTQNPVGYIVGAVAGVVAATTGLIAGFIDPEKAAAKRALRDRGLPKAYADEYTDYRGKSDTELVARAGQLHDKAAKGDTTSLERLAAIRTLRAERGAQMAVAHAGQLAAQPRAGAIPLWAPAALLAIVGVGVAWSLRQRGRR